MPIYHQTWRQQEFVPRRTIYLRDLPKNHLKKIKSVKFEWIDYKVYDKIACLPYERMAIQCLNNYGMKTFEQMQCREIGQFFFTCLQNNAFFGHLKKISPEYFAEDKYSREKPHFDQILI